MKKLFSVFILFALVLGLAACGSKNNGEGTSQETAQESSVQTEGDESGADEDAGGTEAPSDTQGAEQTEEPGEPSPEETQGTGAKALVVYFSATGNTKAVAETLAGYQVAGDLWSGQEAFYCLVLSFLLSGEFSKLLWKIRKEKNN